MSRTELSKRCLSLAVWTLAVCSFASQARANAGLPSIILTFPPLALLFIPIVFGEAFILREFLRVGYWSAVIKAGIANGVSTFLGIPITWLMLVFVQMMAGGGGGQSFDTGVDRILAGTLHTAWLADSGENEPAWAFAAVFLFQFFIFGLSSIAVEFVVLRLLLRQNPPSGLFRAALAMNLVSYGVIMAFPLFMTVVAAFA